MLLWVLVSSFLRCYFFLFSEVFLVRGSIRAIAVFGGGFSGSACKLELKA
jgi:hypothetical protein